jgi:hypothetical protein
MKPLNKLATLALMLFPFAPMQAEDMDKKPKSPRKLEDKISVARLDKAKKMLKQSDSFGKDDKLVVIDLFRGKPYYVTSLSLLRKFYGLSALWSGTGHLKEKEELNGKKVYEIIGRYDPVKHPDTLKQMLITADGWEGDRIVLKPEYRSAEKAVVSMYEKFRGIKENAKKAESEKEKPKRIKFDRNIHGDTI